MNAERVSDMLAIMERARNLDMTWFQQVHREGHRYYASVANGDAVHSIEELHECGSFACFAGYLALSPMFKAAGGTMLKSGAPCWADPERAREESHQVVASYLDISPLLARAMIYGGTYEGTPVYHDYLNTVRASDVADVLRRILSGELQ